MEKEARRQSVLGLPARLPPAGAGAEVGTFRSGLAALLFPGVAFLLGGFVLVNLILMRLRVPSLISAPDPAPSPSLPEPAPVRGRLLSGPTLSLMDEALRCGWG